jgi:polysaccharide biosynthesis transport protein
MNAASDVIPGSDEAGSGGGLAAQIEAVRRRALPMGIAFGAVLMLALLIAAFWPATYFSSGTILIEQQEIPEDFVRSAVTSYADQRVQVISQRVMTTANLTEIINKYGLYGTERKSTPREALVERMRKDVTLEMISANVVDPRGGGGGKATIAFEVGFESPSPELAARVANDVVSLYLRENVETRTRLAEASTEFLTSEAEKLRVRIAELEQRMAVFKEKNYDRLPEFAAANIQSLNAAQQELHDIDSQAQALDQQIAYLDAQLAQVDPNAQAVTKGGERLMTPADRLRALRLELSSALVTYTPKHPVVIGLQREIAALEKQVAAEKGSAAGSAPDNPVYIQLSTQRQAAVNNRAALNLRRAQLQASIAKAQRDQADMPAVERDYGAMVREIDGEQAKYAEIRQKQMTAQLSQNLESEQKGERFTLIEPPKRPQKPIRPNRPAILALGLLMAVGSAVAMLVLLEASDTRIRGRRQVLAMLGVPPLAVIPWVAESPETNVKFRARIRLAGGALAGAVVTLLLVHVLVKPLDVLWASLLRRLGG